MTEIDLNVTQTAHDLTIMGLFWAADPLVKFVMILLVGASIWCWAIIFEKIVGLRRESARAQHFDNEFWSGGSLDDLYDATGANPNNAQARVFSAAMREWRRASAKGLTVSGRADLKASLVDRISSTWATSEPNRYLRLLVWPLIHQRWSEHGADHLQR